MPAWLTLTSRNYFIKANTKYPQSRLSNITGGADVENGLSPRTRERQKPHFITRVEANLGRNNFWSSVATSTIPTTASTSRGDSASAASDGYTRVSCCPLNLIVEEYDKGKASVCGQYTLEGVGLGRERKDASVTTYYL